MAEHRIFTSPSVQEHNVGYGSYGTEEYRMNLIDDWVTYYLNAQEGRFPNARNNPEDSLASVCSASNAFRPERHLAIHSNAGVETAAGTIVFYADGYADSERYANALYNEVAPLSPGADRGVHSDHTLYDTGLYELEHTTATAALIEMGFHTNPADAQSIMDNAREYGKRLARATVTDCGETFIDPDVVQAPPTPVPEVYYRVFVNDVQVASFAIQDNAMNKAAEYTLGHIVVKNSTTGEVLLDETRTVPTPDPKDVKIAELTSALEAATAAGNQVISERDALAQKVNAIKQIVA